ncbi:MAG TPA: FkbM family methyltransferase, partial [Gemmatimonadaceae bacterium]|nr:FkbM family methyltransferase [Gemmatimonadaceae bacterium]
DLGAHSGVTSYHLARMVGPTGRVIAFEPDTTAFEMLCRNIELHRLPNVVPVRRAVAGTSGPRAFNSEGSLGAAFATLVNRRGLAPVTTVECMSLADACAEYGVPHFVKMDIEGAELEVVAAAGDVFREHDIRVAADSFHAVDGQPSASRLESLFRSFGYTAASGAPYGYLTTWAHRQADTTA